MVIALCIVAPAAAAATRVPRTTLCMSVLWSHAYVIGCCAERALLRLPFLSLLTQLKMEEHAERRRPERGGRERGRREGLFKWRRQRQTDRRTDNGRREREREKDKPIEDRLALSGVKER